MIEVKNLTKVYGDHTAVNNLSFTVETGQIYGFLGPNGAGKSTTMNIMTGYIAPTSGEVYIDGHSIFEEPERAKKSIGYLPELPPVYPDMTVLEYLRFCAELKGIPLGKRERAVMDAMAATRVTEMKNRLIKNLSKGYRQRVGLSQAILGSPSVIILDEPTVGLDPAQIIEIRELIKKLAKDHTVILSSHILSEVSAVCDHILIIAHGDLVASDTPEHLAEMMEKSATVEASFRADADTVRPLIEGLAGVQSVELETAADGTTNAVIRTEEDADIREALFYACADARVPLLRLANRVLSLEEMFLELTGTGEEEPEPEPETRNRFGHRKEKNKQAEAAPEEAPAGSGEEAKE